MKRKLLTTLITLSLVLSTALVLPVYAVDNGIYLTTKNGTELTKTQYDNLKKIYTAEDLEDLPSDFLDEIKNEPNLILEDRDEVCVITRTRYDQNDQPVETINTEVSEAEAKRVAAMPETRGSTWQTSSKKLVIEVIQVDGSTKKVRLTNRWLKLPKVRSYDVMALRVTDTSNDFKPGFSAVQQYDGKEIKYSQNGDNVRQPGSFLSYRGIGVSMNIVDSVSSSLSNTMAITILNRNDKTTVYGTYQHATSKVTLAQSKDYDITAGGLGNVLKFSSSVASKYDGMQGVSAEAKWSFE